MCKLKDKVDRGQQLGRLVHLITRMRHCYTTPTTTTTTTTRRRRRRRRRKELQPVVGPPLPRRQEDVFLGDRGTCCWISGLWVGSASLRWSRLRMSPAAPPRTGSAPPAWRPAPGRASAPGCSPPCPSWGARGRTPESSGTPASRRTGQPAPTCSSHRDLERPQKPASEGKTDELVSLQM